MTGAVATLRVAEDCFDSATESNGHGEIEWFDDKQSDEYEVHDNDDDVDDDDDCNDNDEDDDEDVSDDVDDWFEPSLVPL